MKRIFLTTLAAGLAFGGAALAQQSATGQSSGGYARQGGPGEIGPDQRVILRGYVARQPGAVISGGRVSAGYAVPGDVELRAFPDTVYGDVPAARNYRYYSTGDNVVLVDPSSRQVIDVIE